MPARSGSAYLQGLREQPREVWLRGERVADVTTHPGLSGGARAIASLYDQQMALRDSDTVCRLGGDEFVILLADIDGTEAAHSVAVLEYDFKNHLTSILVC